MFVFQVEVASKANRQRHAVHSLTMRVELRLDYATFMYLYGDVFSNGLAIEQEATPELLGMTLWVPHGVSKAKVGPGT
jgi:hypothetical protein